MQMVMKTDTAIFKVE